MRLRILSALRRAKDVDEWDASNSKLSNDRSAGDKDGISGLRRSEMRDLFKSAFVEMDRDLPRGIEEKKQPAHRKKTSPGVGAVK